MMMEKLRATSYKLQMAFKVEIAGNLLLVARFVCYLLLIKNLSCRSFI
jgi:hypothetical protein